MYTVMINAKQISALFVLAKKKNYLLMLHFDKLIVNYTKYHQS